LASYIVRTNRNLAQTEFNIQPRNAVNTTATAVFTDEDEDDDSTSADDTRSNIADLETDGREVVIVQSAPRQSMPVTQAPRKLVTKTGSSKPLFPPVVITFDRDGRERKSLQRPKPE